MNKAKHLAGPLNLHQAPTVAGFLGRDTQAGPTQPRQ